MVCVLVFAMPKSIVLIFPSYVMKIFCGLINPGFNDVIEFKLNYTCQILPMDCAVRLRQCQAFSISSSIWACSMINGGETIMVSPTARITRPLAKQKSLQRVPAFKSLSNRCRESLSEFNVRQFYGEYGGRSEMTKTNEFVSQFN